jgi:hypothetical protein
MAAQLGIACLRPRAPPHHQLWGRVQRRYEEASCGTRHLDILCRRRSTHCSSSQSPAPTLRPRSRSSGLVATRQLAAPGRARACAAARPQQGAAGRRALVLHQCLGWVEQESARADPPPSSHSRPQEFFVVGPTFNHYSSTAVRRSCTYEYM